jgi:hypothetical protein
MKQKTLGNSFALTVATLILATSCGKKKEKVEEQLNRIDEKHDLQGTFQSDGKNQLSIVTLGLGCVAHTLDISGSKFVTTQTAYKEVNCQGAALGSIRSESEMKVGSEISVAPGARALNLKVVSVSITRFNDSWSEVFGVDVSGEWRISEVAVASAKDVSGLNCGSLGKFPAVGQVYFTSYRLANDKTLEFTKLAQESWENIGSEENPAPRNERLLVNYYRR